MSDHFEKKFLNSRRSFTVKEIFPSISSKKLSTSQMLIPQSKKQKTKLIIQQPLQKKISQFQPNDHMQSKQHEIQKLRRNLDLALKMAANEKKVSSSIILQNFKNQKTQSWFENKIVQLQKIILSQRQEFKSSQKKINDLNDQLSNAKQQLKCKQQQCTKIMYQKQQLIQLTKQIPRLKILLKDQQPLKQRIKVLQTQVRNEKIQAKDISGKFKQQQKQKQKLIEQLRIQKPLQQELRQKIAYQQRVNLDLQRKMQDFSRRQNEYLKLQTINKKAIKKLTQQNAQLQNKLFSTSNKLVIKQTQCQQLSLKLLQSLQQISRLQTQLHNQKQSVYNATSQLQSTKQFYRTQQVQNAQLKQKNQVLLQHRAQYQRTLSHFQKVNDQINQIIISRVQQITKLSQVKEFLEEQLSKLQEKYEQFQVIFQDRTDKGDNIIKQFFYVHMRQNTKLKLQNKELVAEIQERVLKFGEERDTWSRNQRIRSNITPSNEELFGQLYHEKNEELILLQGSNDQLLKIKDQLDLRVKQLQSKVENYSKLLDTINLKDKQIIQLRAELQKTKQTVNRLEQTIKEQSSSIKDYEEQLIVLRDKINVLNQRNFQLDLDGKNIAVKLKEIQNVMAEINADSLIQKMNINQKNTRLLADSLEKLQNGMKSLEFYFQCSFCGKLADNPITLAPCGHTYCQQSPKCKQAYSEFCYQCDTGMPIQCVFKNKYMKQAYGKYQFFKIVLMEVTENINFLKKEK